MPALSYLPKCSASFSTWTSGQLSPGRLPAALAAELTLSSNQSSLVLQRGSLTYENTISYETTAAGCIFNSNLLKLSDFPHPSTLPPFSTLYTKTEKGRGKKKSPIPPGRLLINLHFAFEYLDTASGAISTEA